jgi:hypothetical protein
VALWHRGRISVSPLIPKEKGGERMVSFEDLFLFCDLIVSLIGLILLVCNKKK